MTDGAARAPGRQIALDLPPPPPRLTRQSFVIGQSNEAAFRTMESWAKSDEAILVICGPQGAGKSHLAQVLRSEPGGETLVVVDDADRQAPEYVLEVIQSALGGGRRLVLVGRNEPDAWAHGLSDLRTRLAAALRISVAEPDEALLRSVMEKLFRDRQLQVAAPVIDYAVARLPKTFAAAQAFVSALDAASIEKGTPFGRKLAREVVANLSEEPPEA